MPPSHTRAVLSTFAAWPDYRRAKPKEKPLQSAAERLFQHGGNAIGIVRDHLRSITEVRKDRSAGRGLKLTSVISIDVVGVLQDVAGQHRDNILSGLDGARRYQFLESGEGGGRGRLAADSAASDDRFSVRDLLLSNSLDGAARCLNLE